MMENSANFSDNEHSGCCCESDTDFISLVRGFNSYDILVRDFSVRWCEWVIEIERDGEMAFPHGGNKRGSDV